MSDLLELRLVGVAAVHELPLLLGVSLLDRVKLRLELLLQRVTVKVSGFCVS